MRVSGVSLLRKNGIEGLILAPRFRQKIRFAEQNSVPFTTLEPTMFIERQHHPAIEFDAAAGQQEPTLVHFFSDRAEPFKTVLPLLVAGAAQGEQRVLVVTSPLSKVVDETIRLHRDPEFKGQVIVDEKHRLFFEMVQTSLRRALEKLEQIEFVKLDDEEEEGA